MAFAVAPLTVPEGWVLMTRNVTGIVTALFAYPLALVAGIPVYFGQRRCGWLSLWHLVCTLVVFPTVAHAQGCSIFKHTEPALAPLLGTMSGVQLKFPRTKFGGGASIHYGDNKDWWSGRRDALPGPDTSVRNFMITLNRETLKPPITEADVRSYAANFRVFGDDDLPSTCSRWVEFIFSPALYDSVHGSLKALYEEQVASATSLSLGPVVVGGTVYGLRRSAAGHSLPDPVQAAGRIIYDTWFFDERSWRTLISCTHFPNSRSALKLSCDHYFVVPELKAIAKWGYMAMADVADWQKLQAAFYERSLSYIVQPSEVPPHH